MSSFDVLIRGGTVVDGTGGIRTRADVGIRGDRIEAIGDLSDAEAPMAIDATGKIVSPGFIDVHNHTDGWLIKKPHFDIKTRQGITTEVLMSDGISYAPVDKSTAPQWLYYLRSLNALRMDEYTGWETIEDYAATIAGRNVQNFCCQVPYANVRSLVCGFGEARVNDFHRQQIEYEVRKGMEHGATGLSTGIDYIVQCHCTTDDLVDACRATADHNGVYVTHVRYKLGLLGGIQEAVEIGKRAGVAVHISHLKIPSLEEADAILGYIDREARHALDFSFDAYPYQPGSTMLSYILPYEIWNNGPLGALQFLGDPETRARIARGLDNYRLPMEKLTLAWVPGKENRCHIGKTLEEYVEFTGQSTADALIDLLIEERLAVLIVFNEGEDELIRPVLQHDLHILGSDGIYFPDSCVHPRVAGSVGRMLGRCVRDWKLFSLEEAVHKVTERAAERFGMIDRGVLRAAAYADVVVFDEDTINDEANYEEPLKDTVGVEQVLVNGVRIIRDGEPVEDLGDELPGRYLRYQQS